MEASVLDQCGGGLSRIQQFLHHKLRFPSTKSRRSSAQMSCSKNPVNWTRKESSSSSSSSSSSNTATFHWVRAAHKWQRTAVQGIKNELVKIQYHGHGWAGLV
ncbi:hypothetical protein Dimus_018729 [Dionaea muscipula]